MEIQLYFPRSVYKAIASLCFPCLCYWLHILYISGTVTVQIPASMRLSGYVTDCLCARLCVHDSVCVVVCVRECVSLAALHAL